MTTLDAIQTNTKLPSPPLVPGLPVLGNALDFLNRPMEFFVESYHKHGPIYRIKVANQNYVVLGGLEANKFLAQAPDHMFSSKPLFGEFAKEMDAPSSPVVLDGEPHRHMRKVMQRGYSKSGLCAAPQQHGAPHLSNCPLVDAR